MKQKLQDYVREGKVLHGKSLGVQRDKGSARYLHTHRSRKYRCPTGFWESSIARHTTNDKDVPKDVSFYAVPTRWKSILV